MDAQRYRRIKDVLFGALRRRGPARDAFLDQECQGDEELRHEVERLLEDTARPTEDLVPRTPVPTDPTALERSELPVGLGPYTLERVVGRGGMGVVFDAHHKETGERVALKVVHPHLLAGEAMLDRFRREAELGQRVQHENVVAVRGLHAFGEDERTQHALVMEYVEGENLRSFQRRLGTVPEGLLRELGAQIAAGLAAIHAAGIVHRDLKPENVMVTPDNRVRIMDLGVARLVNASIELTRTGQFVGSLSYASPEQFSSDDVGPAADLYGLGVLLYELACGTNPFERGDVAAVMHAHLGVEPQPLAERDTDCSDFFSAVVQLLLAKDPASRFGSGRELADVLSEGEAGAWWRERTSVRAHRPSAHVQVRRDTSVHGRETELQRLREAWRAACNGSGGTVLVEGEAGIGKSRLVDAFLREIDPADANVLYGSFPPSGGQRALCEGLLAAYGRTGLEGALSRYCCAVQSLVPAFAAMVCGDATPAGVAALDSDAVLVMCRHLMAGMAAERPTIWVFDDLHFAPEEVRAMTLGMARSAPEHRALLVLTSRSRVLERERENLWRLPGFLHLRLGRLSPREVVDLLREAFRSDDVADRLGARIAYKSDGVPFFVFEMIRALEEERFLERAPDGSFVQARPVTDIEVPSAVRDLIVARLSDLTRDERSILDVAAVLGHEFDAGLIAPVLGQRLVGVLRDLAEIERHHGVVRAAGRLHRFDHHQFQEVVYAEIPEALRAEYHALLAETFAERAATLGRELTGAESEFLARHHLSGGRPHEALAHLQRAFEHLEGQALFENAVDLARRALDAPGLIEGEERLELLLRTSRAEDTLSHVENQDAHARSALALAERLGGPLRAARARHAIGLAHIARSELDAAVREFTRAAELAREADDLAVEGAVTNALGNALSILARFAEAREALERCLFVAREVGDRGLAANALTNLGTVMFQGERDDLALKALEKGLEVAIEAGDGRAEAFASHRLGAVILSHGRPEDARPYFERTIALCDAIGHRSGALMSRGNLGLVHLDFGRLDLAREQFIIQLRSAEELEHAPALSQSTSNLGTLDLALGRPDEALVWIERAVGYARDGANPRMVQHVLRLQAEALRRVGDLDGAGRTAEAALAASRTADDPAHEGEVLTEMAAQALARSDFATAQVCVDRARDVLASLDAPEQLYLAELQGIQIPGADPSAARAGLAGVEGRFGLLERIHCRHLLWRATHDRDLLPEARRMIEFCRDNAPPEYRESIIERVPAHAELISAARGA